MFDSTQRGSAKTASAKAHKLELAESIISTLCGHSSFQENFIRLFEVAEQEIKRILSRWRLTKIVEDEQIKNTITDFIEDLSASPDENRFTARLLAMVLQQAPDMRQQVQYYASRRLFTLLKQNAAGQSQEYFAFNETIKKLLKVLIAENGLRLTKSGYYSAAPAEVVCVPADANFFSLAALEKLKLNSWVIKGKIKKDNLKAAILALLADPQHQIYCFKVSVISTALFNLTESMLLPNTELNPKNSSSLHLEPQELCELNAAAASILEQIKLQFDELQRLPILLAGLAYCFISCSDYFLGSEFIEEHQQILNSDAGTVDRVHKFLNTKQFSNLFIKEVGRSTAFNRISSFKTLIEATLTDFSVEAQQAGIKSLVDYMLTQYHSLVRRQS